MKKWNIIKLLKKHIILSITVIILIIILSTGSILCIQTHKQKDTVYNNIYFEEVNLSSLTIDETKLKLDDYFNKKLDSFNFEFIYGDLKETINCRDLGLYYDIDSISNEILNTGKTGNLLKDTLNRLFINYNSKQLSLSPKIDSSKIDNKIKHFVSLINTEKKDATISFNGSSMNISESKKGYEIDEETLQTVINKTLTAFNISESPHIIEIPVNVIEPAVEAETLKKMEILGSYSTSLASSAAGRTQNIRIFMNMLSNKILLPGEVFSCDKEGGERSKAEGYTSAPGYSGNKVVPVLAGGICQGVTTLYNAVLYADLEIVERSPHSLPVTYAPIGRDATLAKNQVDFKFKNNQQNPIAVQTYVANGNATATIWGIKENPNKKVVIDVKKYGPKSSETFKYTYDSDKLIKSERLSKDRYN